MAIINSLLDTDFYKLTMQQAVLEKYPDANVTYSFTNRGKHRFNESFIKYFKSELESMSELELSVEEAKWLTNNCPSLKPWYIAYLKSYRFKPSEVSFELTSDNNLKLDISGPWHRTILWEVPLMALISEIYFDTIDTQWSDNFSYSEYGDWTIEKFNKMRRAGCLIADFGTRRRRSKDIHEQVVESLNSHTRTLMAAGFLGTSNVELAMLYDLKPIGTCAHEWTMGISALESLRYANRFALDKWSEVYNGQLGIALTDTFGTEAFFKDFNLQRAKLYDGVRHDSGDPFIFAEKMITHYRKLGIDPTSKTIVFSDSLDPDLCIKINEQFSKQIKCVYGIGTNLTNDKHYRNFEDQTPWSESSPPLNIVIKLKTCNNIHVVKLSDNQEKATGNIDAIKVAKWTFFNNSLENE